MSKLTNKIEAHDRKVSEVLENKKYTVDYFQREYNWQRRHIEQLITDLTNSFLNEYQPGDARTAGENYNNYYLGPFVVSEKDGQRSIIDGQQRLTSITLLLIYLNNLQNTLGFSEKIEPMIFSEHRGMKSFNIQVEERRECLEKLFHTGAYALRNGDDPSTVNMTERYVDITELFPEEIKGESLPFFIDWLKFNVVLVEIVAYSDDNAYTIFETMNDRGLNLTPTEMLKGFILSRFNQPAKRIKANDDWKKAIEVLKGFDANEDQTFFQAWLRASYADTIRPGKAGSQNEDFEKIGTRFHSWVRDNLKKMGLDPERPDDFEHFVAVDFKFYHEAYVRILRAQKPKSRAGYRTIPMGPETLRAIKKSMLSRKAGDYNLVFPCADGHVIKYDYFVHHWWPKLMLRAGLAKTKIVTYKSAPDKKVKMIVSKFHPYALRHVAASRWIEMGLMPKRIQELMGHSSLKMTMDIYGHLWVNPAADKEIAAVTEQAFA